MKGYDFDEIIYRVFCVMYLLLLGLGIIGVAMRLLPPMANTVADALEKEPDNAVVVQDIFQEPTVYYELTAEERDLIERVVMGEAGGEEYIGQQAVAQCILNACELTSARPAAIIESLSYTTHRSEASQSVKDAVSEVFDDGVKILPETAMYFYAPGLVHSEWHETQEYLCTIGCHRFFARRG